MTTTAPTILSGHCGIRRHPQCLGVYGGYDCRCQCHTAPPRSLRIGSLFSGYGGLEQGVQAVLGGTVAWHSDIDPGACKILAHRYPDVPNLGDITTVDWSAVEPVDVLTGGSPCQDLSHAGKRGGMTEGTRSNLWVSMREAIAQLRPSLVVWENVRGAYSACADSELGSCPGCVDGREPHRPLLRAVGRVLGDLSSLGYDASWHGLRAADVGAPHGRFRVFVAAWPAADAGSLRGQPWGFAASGQAAGGRSFGVLAGRGGAPAADTSGDGRHEGRTEPARLVGGSDAALGGHGPLGPDGRCLCCRLAPEFCMRRPEGEWGTPLAANTLGVRGERRGGHGDVAGPSGTGEGHRGEREWHGDAADDCGAVAADAGLDGCEGLAPAHDDDGAIASGNVAERRTPAHPEDGAAGQPEGAHPAALVSPGPGAGAGDRPGGTAAGVGGLDGVAGPEWGPFAPAVHRWERLTRTAPAPVEQDWDNWRRRRRSFLARRRASKRPVGRRGEIPREMWAGPSPRLSPAFVEWMQGLPAGWVTDVPGLTRNEQLKALGNGVVPQQCAAALRLLLANQMEEAA